VHASSVEDGASTAADAASTSEEVATYSVLRVAELFKSYLRLVNGSGGLADLVDLHVKFIQALAGSSGAFSSTVDQFEGLDCAVLLSWRALTAAHQIRTKDLLVSLNAEEELLLVECALSVTLRCRSAPRPGLLDPLSLHPEASEVLRHLIPVVLGGGASSEHDAFWMRFADKTQQLRALWSAVTASRHYGADGSGGQGGEAATMELLSALLQELTSCAPGFSLWLPHVHGESRQRISQAVCQDLVSGIQYEAEVRDLVGSYLPTRAWAQGVLAQIRLGQRLQSLLDFQSTASEAPAGSPSADGLPRSIPLLLLEACRHLNDSALWLEVVSVVLDAAVCVTSSSDAIISRTWLAGLLQNLLMNVPAAPATGGDLSADVASVVHSTAVVLYVYGVGEDLSDESRAIVLDCVRLYDLISSLSTMSFTAGIPFVHTFVHVLTDRTTRFLSTGDDAALVSELWSTFNSLIGSGAVSLSSLPALAWGCLVRLTVELWEALDRTMSKPLRHTMLSVLMRLIEVSPDLSASCKGEFYVHCHFEILDNSLHESLHESGGAKRKRKRDTSRVSPAPSQPSVLPSMLRKALEELVFDESFETNFVQRVQREITFVLGQVYFYSFGFPMVPLDGASDDEDEESDNWQPNKPQFDGRDVGLVGTLYKYCKVCIKGGWVNKAEIRASLLVLSRAEAFHKQPLPALSAIADNFFSASQAPSERFAALATELQEVNAQGGETADPIATDADPEEGLLRAVGSELFFTLLQLGLPASDVGDRERSAGPDADSTTSLAAACDLGQFLRDSNQGAVVDLCMMDLAHNPLRYSSWSLLLRQYMEAFNAVMDELQKLVLPSRLPKSCYQAVVSDYISLVRPPARSSGGAGACCLWTPHAAVPHATVTHLLQAASAALVSPTQSDLQTIFADSASSETFLNLNRAADPPDYEKHLHKLAHLIAIRNATFTVYERMSAFVNGAVRSGLVEVRAEGEDESIRHWQAEMEVLVLSNAAKCYAKDADERIALVASSLPPLKQGLFASDLLPFSSVIYLSSFH